MDRKGRSGAGRSAGDEGAYWAYVAEEQRRQADAPARDRFTIHENTPLVSERTKV